MKSPLYGRSARPGLTIAVATALCVTVFAGNSRAVEKSTHMVPMRDGTRLATDVLLPDDAKSPLPVILIRTPYGRVGTGRGMAARFCPAGCAVVSQDMRGRGQSEGSDAVFFHNDGWGKRQDGLDTLNWVTSQKWCNGKVGTWGGSALGITQNMLAPVATEALKAQYVSVAFSDMYTDLAYQGGAFRKELLEIWLERTKADPANLKAFRAHPRYDEFWTVANALPQAHRVNAPGIFRGGWYDIVVQGTINSFTSIQNGGAPGAKGKCRLVIGPWAHGKFDELKYPANAETPPKAVDLTRWFDHYLKGVDNGVPQDKAVHYYVMGDPDDPDAPGNFWRSADTWPPPAVATKYHLHADGKLSTARPQADDAKLSYKYDPKNPVPTVGGQNLNIPKGPRDQHAVESRPDVLLFTGPTLSEPLEVTGRIRAKLYISSDCPDTDFTVKLSDVYPDGRSMLVTDGIFRARYRKSFQREDLLEPGKVYELTVDLWSTSIVFNRGHKIRVAVSSSNSPRFEPNPNTGGPVGEQSASVATNTVHLSRDHASHMLLPLYSGK